MFADSASQNQKVVWKSVLDSWHYLSLIYNDQTSNGIRTILILPLLILSMKIDINKYNPPFTLYGNGQIPHHQIPLDKLKKSGTIISIDGGADKLKSLKLDSHIILGDLDSLKKAKADYECLVFELKDQSKSDLEKSLDWCINNGIKDLSLVGFSGGEDDHWMAALWTLINYYEKLNLLFYSNTATIFCVNGEQTIKTISGQTVSIIPSKDETRITLKNLKYSFKDQILYPPSFGIRNLALGSSFFIKTTKPVWIFLSYH